MDLMTGLSLERTELGLEVGFEVGRAPEFEDALGIGTALGIDDGINLGGDLGLDDGP